jgi:hypothetical protein
MTTQKKHCLLSICLIFMVIQSVSVAEVTKAWLDVNDIFAVWQNAYCNFEIPKISYIYDGQQRTTLQEILSSESGIKVSICNTDGLSCAEYASDGNQTSIYFSNSKSATITKFERDPMFYGKYGSVLFLLLIFYRNSCFQTARHLNGFLGW